ncbi:hypothetical protein [Demequina sp.]|uniref:hypothetical protein n=1 Tax=Demequina sp. TaxID=2050685 RepID=UPI0025DAFB77|nr:hypothetical protein [Demequina sp.]
MTPEQAVEAILARSEDYLGDAVAGACYEAVLALQEAGASGAERVAAISAFAEAKRRIRADMLDLLTLEECEPPRSSGPSGATGGHRRDF